MVFDFIFRPATVEVEVLPPVDTSDWTVASVNKHVADVRNLFVEALKLRGVEDEKEAVVSKRKPTRKATVKTAAKTKPKSKTKAKVKPKPKAKPKTKAKPKQKSKRT